MSDLTATLEPAAQPLLRVFPTWPLSELAAARIVGGVLILASHSRIWADGPLELLQSSVTPSLPLGQFHYYTDARGLPLAFCNWAFLNDAVLAEILRGRGALRPEEYLCGETPYIAELLAPFGHCREVLSALRRLPAFNGRRVYGYRNKIDERGRRTARLGYLAFRRLDG